MAVRDRIRIPPALKPLVNFVSSVTSEYSRLNVSLVSGGISYFVMLALAPMAIAIGGIAGMFIDSADVAAGWKRISDQSPDTLSALTPAINALVSLAEKSSSGSVTIASVSSALIAIYVSQKVVYGVGQVQDDIFHGTSAKRGIVARGWSAIVALIGILTVVALLLALSFVPPVLRDLGVEGGLIDFLSSFPWLFPVVGVYFSVWLLIRHYARDVHKVGGHSPGVIFATLWIIGSIGVFGLYANLSSTVGSALVVFGAPIAILIWTYLVFIGFFIGSVITSVFHSEYELAGGLVRKPFGRSGDQGNDESATGSPNPSAD